MELVLGKIEKAEVGVVENRFGLHVTLSLGDCVGACPSETFWDLTQTPHKEFYKWTEDDRSSEMRKTCLHISSVLYSSKKAFVSELVGVPIEAAIKANTVVSWRVLTEVL